MNVLVAGGAGYIGSHALKRLLDSGHKVVAVDNLCHGHRRAVDGRAVFQQVALAETAAVATLLREHQIDCVMHFAALIAAGESVEDPLSYYENNTAGTISLLQAMKAAGCKRLVFSSTAAVYGEPGKGDRHLLCEAPEGPSGQKVPVTFSHSPIIETMPGEPVNPYGWSKWCVERVLKDYAASDPRFAFVALRYFNVAGAAADGSLGEDHKPESHLIPALLLAALGRREPVTLFGTDYPTPDGTCIRDYIHVEDLCEAHVLAMDALRSGDGRVYNLGIGRGYSVREVIEAARQVTGGEVPIRFGPRRPGDPAVLFADAQKARRELGWTPRYTELQPIIATAWKWFESHPRGYEKG